MCNWTGWDLREFTVTVRSFPDQWPAFRRRKPPASIWSKANDAVATAWTLTSASRRAVAVASRASGSRLQCGASSSMTSSPRLVADNFLFQASMILSVMEARTWWVGTRRSLRNRKSICLVHYIFHFYYLFSVFTIYFCFLNYYCTAPKRPSSYWALDHESMIWAKDLIFTSTKAPAQTHE